LGQKLVGIAILIVFGVIIADLVLHPAGTGVLVNGITSIWRTGLQGAGGQTITG
jgi:hypothetical protein